MPGPPLSLLALHLQGGCRRRRAFFLDVLLFFAGLGGGTFVIGRLGAKNPVFQGRVGRRKVGQRAIHVECDT